MHVMLRAGGPYRTGWLTQACSECGWKETTKETEKVTCPACGGEVLDGRSLQVGITHIRFRKRKNRFYLRDEATGQELILFESDFPDLLKFMLRHFRDWSDQFRYVRDLNETAADS